MGLSLDIILGLLLTGTNPLVALLETKMQEHQALLDVFNFNNMIQVHTTGNSGGLVLLWDDTQIDVEEITTSNQEIHAMIKGPPRPTGESSSAA